MRFRELLRRRPILTISLTILGCLLLIVLLATVITWAVVYQRFLAMPGESYSGEAPPLTSSEVTNRDLMRGHVDHIAGTIGPRNVHHAYEELGMTAKYIEDELRALGYEPTREYYEVEGLEVWNVLAEIPGTQHPNDVIVIGAHYDTVRDSPGADDNTSAVAMNLALAKTLRDSTPACTIRFDFFTNEERPWAHTPLMGSFVSAKNSKQRGERVRMICLEMVGYFTDEPIQRYPVEQMSIAYPETGDFLAFVTFTKSEAFLRQTIGEFRKTATIRSVGLAAPEIVRDISRSDHWSYLQHDYPAIMLTDTSNFRTTLYHTAADLPETLDYDAMARIESALATTILEIAKSP